MNGNPVSRSGSMQAGSRDSMMDFSCFLWIDISPGPEGINPLFLAISSLERVQQRQVYFSESLINSKGQKKDLCLPSLLGFYFYTCENY